MRTFFDLLVETYNKYSIPKKEKEVPDFLKSILVHIDYKLRTNDVNFEIPFVYKNKKDFDHLKVIVPNYFTPQQLCEIIEGDEFKGSKDFVDVIYKNFRIVFILVPENSIPITFWYYSWDILPILMSILFDKFGLSLTKDGLKLKSKGNFLLSTKIDEIVEFLGLNFKQYRNGFFTLENEVNFLMNSPSFNADLFFDYVLDPKDYFYKENLELYKKCLEIFEPFKGAPGNFKFAENTDEYLPFIVEYFQESGIMEKLFGKKNKYIKESKN